MNMKRTILGIAVVAMGVSANAVTQKFTEEELAYMPATAHVPADVDATPAKKADVNGKPYGGLSFCLTFQWNMMSAYPIVDVPAGLSSRNVPIGVQVIANTYDDLEAYRVAASLSKTLPQNYRDGRFPDFRNRK